MLSFHRETMRRQKISVRSLHVTTQGKAAITSASKESGEKEVKFFIPYVDLIWTILLFEEVRSPF